MIVTRHTCKIRSSHWDFCSTTSTCGENMTIMNPRTLDSLDGRIILALDEDPEASALALSRTLGVARNTVHARLARLERSGALRSFSRRLDPAALGLSLIHISSPRD